jgi:class 3 adenylate cyclase
MTDLQRKTVAIMFTDIFGYSRLMSLDEERTIELLAEHDQIVEKQVSSCGGKILKRMGDAVFAQFATALEALNCAIGIQERLRTRNEGKKPEDRILLRIGLHKGAVIVKGDDLFGEGVNVAARLEPLADPGGICISQSVYDAVIESTPIEIVKIGDVSLKNIIEKYVVYKIPSIYAGDIPDDEVLSDDVDQVFHYRTKSVTDLPVNFLSPLELTVYSLLFCAGLIWVIAAALSGDMTPDSTLYLLQRKALPLAVAAVCLVLFMVYFHSSRCVRILFEDIRDVDRIMGFLISRIGYNSPSHDDNSLIYKPSLYNFVMFGARKIKTVADGNSVVISGNYMFVGKLLRMIRSYEAGGW